MESGEGVIGEGVEGVGGWFSKIKIYFNSHFYYYYGKTIVDPRGIAANYPGRQNHHRSS